MITGTTGSVLEQELDLQIHRLESGPLGADQQIGAKISSSRGDQRQVRRTQVEFATRTLGPKF